MFVLEIGKRHFFPACANRKARIVEITAPARLRQADQRHMPLPPRKDAVPFRDQREKFLQG